jgi:hypothetical protein
VPGIAPSTQPRFWARCTLSARVSRVSSCFTRLFAGPHGEHSAGSRGWPRLTERAQPLTLHPPWNASVSIDRFFKEPLLQVLVQVHPLQVHPLQVQRLPRVLLQVRLLPPRLHHHSARLLHHARLQQQPLFLHRNRLLFIKNPFKWEMVGTPRV